MTGEEIRYLITEIRASLEPLRKDIEDALEREADAEETSYLIEGEYIAPKLDAPLFAELGDLRRTFDRCNHNALRVYTDATEDLRKVERAIKTNLLYVERIGAEDSLDLEELKELAQNNIENALKLISEVDEIYLSLCKLAGAIYFRELDADEILSEVRAVADSFYTLGEDIGEEGFKTPKSKRGVITSPAEQSLNILADINTPYITGSPRYIPSKEFFNAPLKKKREELEAVIRPYFEGYQKALEKYNSPRKEAEVRDIISKLLDRLSDAKNILTTRPDTFYATIDKVSNQLTLLTPNELWELDVTGERDEKKGEEVITEVTLTFKDERDLNNLDHIDDELFNVCVTIWETAQQSGAIKDGTVVVSLQTIYQLLTKNFNSRLEDEEREKELADRLLKLNGANLDINAKAESKYYKDLKDFSRQGSMLNIVIDGAVLNGTYVERAVHIIRLDLSPRYAYAKAKKGITSTKIKLLKTQAKSKNDENILMESYIRMRIETAKRQGYELLTSSILEYAGIDFSQYKNPKDKKQRTIKKITDIMNSYKKNGYIKGWRYEQKSRDKYYKIVFKK